MTRLDAAVGPGKPNRFEDVKLIQALLNSALKMTNALRVDGRYGPKTQAAIVSFQSRPGVTPKPDGVIDPNGQTFHKLSSSASASTRQVPPNVRSFIDRLLPSARKAKQTWGVPVGAMIAQGALETGWGTSVKGNAYFGIKGKSPSGASTTFTTHEVMKGQSVKIDDSFRAYTSLDEAADDYGRFLKSNPRYAGAFAYTDEPEKFVAVVAAAGYATDPLYATKLTQIIRSYDLAQYDR